MARVGNPDPPKGSDYERQNKAYKRADEMAKQYHSDVVKPHNKKIPKQTKNPVLYEQWEARAIEVLQQCAVQYEKSAHIFLVLKTHVEY